MLHFRLRAVSIVWVLEHTMIVPLSLSSVEKGDSWSIGWNEKRL